MCNGADVKKLSVQVDPAGEMIVPSKDCHRPARGLIADGDAVRCRRKEMGLTQKELAKKAGISQKSVMRVESQQGSYSTHTIRQIACILDCGVKDICYSTGGELTSLPEGKCVVTLLVEVDHETARFDLEKAASEIVQKINEFVDELPTVMSVKLKCIELKMILSREAAEKLKAAVESGEFVDATCTLQFEARRQPKRLFWVVLAACVLALAVAGYFAISRLTSPPALPQPPESGQVAGSMPATEAMKILRAEIDAAGLPAIFVGIVEGALTINANELERDKDVDVDKVAEEIAGILQQHPEIVVEVIDFVNTDLSDAGIKHFEPLDTFRQLWIHSTKVSPDGRRALQQSRFRRGLLIEILHDE